jgi:TRAP-type mannitol/chloroaromatic compound transport system substrate-binding protein
MPFDQGTAGYVRWLKGEGGELLDQFYRRELKLSVRALPCGLTGKAGDWYRTALKSGDDLKGLKIRTGTVDQAVLKCVGAVPQLMALGDVSTALQKRTINAANAGSLQSDLVLGLDQGAKFLHYPSWTRTPGVIELLIHEGVWNKLGAVAQGSLKALCAAQLTDMQAALSRDETVALSELSRRGVQILPYPNDVLQRLEAASTVEKTAMLRDAFTARVFNSLERAR